MAKVVSVKELEQLVSNKTHFKIAVTPETSEIVQNAIFRAGGAWNGTFDVTQVKYVSKPYLYYLGNSSSGITYSELEHSFRDNKGLEIELNLTKFGSQQEIWEYLFSGGIVKKGNNYFYKIIDGNLYFAESVKEFETGEYDRTTQPFRSYEEWEKYIPKNWWDEIPGKGVLCWVWDHSEANKEMSIITAYDPDEKSFPFESTTSCFKNAVPLTKEEVLQYILEDK